MMVHHETIPRDTNKALASLDESQEGHGETKSDAEEAIGVEYSHDLDIFLVHFEE